MNLNTIIKNSTDLFQNMSLGSYTYRELQRITNFTETDLCYAIMYLLRVGRIRQYRTDENVVYEIVV